MKTDSTPRQFFLLVFLVCVQLCFFSQQASAQPGKDGPMTITAPNTVVNCYSAVNVDVPAGSNTVKVDNAGGIDCDWQCGDLIMLYQAQGASINTTNTSAYGTITNYNNSGHYELNYVTNYSGNTITVQTPWTNSFTASGRVQLVKVPQYTTLTINAGASIVPFAWQDVGSFRYGGIVAIDVLGTTTINGSINASGYGFRPGVLDNTTSTAGAGQVSIYVSTNAADGAAKGESIVGFNDIYDGAGGRYGRGAPANGGGGGNGHNCGGGGGSNGNNGAAYDGNGVMCTTCTGSAAWSLDPFVIASGGTFATSSGGGRGGYSYSASNQNALTLGPTQASWGGDYRDPFGGYGGKPLTAAVATNRIFFGGGGGAGDANNSANMVGGTGGGIVYLVSGSVTGVGQINANGTDALNQIASGTAGANDAPSGGAGGGSVIVRSASIASSISINAKGGKGGDQGALATEAEGPGGGGGAGFVAITTGTPTINISGGDNGITLSGSLTEFTPNGATKGASGQSTSIAAVVYSFDPFGPIVTSSNSPVCTGQTILLTTTAVAGATYSWTGPGGFTSTVQNPSRAGATVAMSGTYHVTYTTSGGCSDTSSTPVVVNPTPVVSGTGVNPLCNGDCNGTATVNITSGGTPAYTFAWSNGQITQTASALCAGTYSVTVTDAHSCTATTSVTITNPPVLTASATFVQPLCNGACNGSITVTASGGTAPYTYSIDGGSFVASNVFSSVCAGTHVMIVKDAHNCTFTFNVIVTQPTPVAVTMTASTASTCGSANGSATFSASGGTPTYMYSLDGGASQPGGTFSSLVAGSHTVVVTDSKGCTATLTVSISSFGSPVASILSQHNLSCFGGADGSVLVGATGGTSPYQYRKVPGVFGPSNSFTGLTAGTYTFEVKDANGCVSSVTTTITSPTQVTYTTTPTPASCNGVCDGQILVNASGGTPPYLYSSNNGLTFGAADPLTGLCAGNIFVVVKDANGCLANSIVNISQPTAVSATFANVNPFCHDVCNGQVVANGTGGTPGYQYSLNGGAFQPSGTFTGVCSGPQTVVVQDSHGCQFTSTQTLVNPAPIIIDSISSGESNCGFNNGFFEVQATGPNPPFQYSANGGPNQPTGLFTSLVAGAYDVLVTDALGCTAHTFVGVNDVEMSGMLNSITNVTCYGGSDGAVSTVATGGFPPIQYELDASGSFMLSGDFTGLSAGPHIVVMVDNGFCIYTIPFDVTQPDPITFSETVVNVSCNAGTNGQIQFNTVAGGNGIYQYSINNGATYQASPNFTGLPVGTYQLVVQDQFGCTGTGSATITQPTPVTFTVNETDLTCFNNGTGFAQFVAAGGTPSYTYSFNGGAFGPGFTFFGLNAGTYNFCIKDNNGCTVCSTVTVNQPTPLAATYSTTQPLCNGSCDGTITVNASGATPAYVYSSDGGTTYGVASVLTGLCAGSQNVVVKDNNGCQIGTSLSLMNPAPIVFSTNVTDATCGNNNGQIQVTGVGGGTGTYQYALNGGAPQVSNIFNPLTPGSYTVTVNDGNGCTVTAPATVADLSAPTLVAALHSDPLCNASCDGTITINATGGTGGPLQYSINGGAFQSSPNFTGLCAGTYLAVIQDPNGCGDSTTVTLTDPAVLNITPVATSLNCFNDNTGMITVTTTGGTIPYQYSYDGGTTFVGSNIDNFIAAGTYNIVVTDGHNCTASGTVTVNQPTAVTVSSLAVTNASCNASCDGQVTVSPAGGTPGYTYVWSPSSIGTAASPTASGLCAGSYAVTVKDNHNCTVSTNFTITEPPALVISNIAWTDVLCNGDCNGTATITAPGGVQYSLNGGAPQPSNNFTGLCPGIFPLVVTDINGCTANAVVVIGEPAVLQLFTTPDTMICINDTTPLYAVAVGGTTPYTYHWSNTPANISYQDVQPVGPTTYTVYVVDSNGCTSPTNNINVTIRPQLTGSISNDTTICQGSTVTFNATGANGLPYYSYQWTGTTDTLSSYTVTPPAPGSYSVIISDQCNDIVNLSVNVSFFAQPAVNFTADVTGGCSPLTVQFTNTTPVGDIGASPCEWYNGSTLMGTGCDTISYTFTAAGCYDISLTVTSPNGCSQNFQQASMVCVYPDPVAAFYTTSDPSPPTILQSQLNYVNTSTNAVSYVWSFPDGASSTLVNPVHDFKPDSAGFYQVCLIATSPDGCLDTTCQEIQIHDVLLLYVPNAFTPDGDGVNDFFTPILTGADKDLYDFMIFNRWGQLIFQTGIIGLGWDGTFKGLMSKEDVYVWKIKFREKETGVNKEYYGHVTLLK